jgi:hypothetical protein
LFPYRSRPRKDRHIGAHRHYFLVSPRPYPDDCGNHSCNDRNLRQQAANGNERKRCGHPEIRRRRRYSVRVQSECGFPVFTGTRPEAPEAPRGPVQLWVMRG